MLILDVTSGALKPFAARETVYNFGRVDRVMRSCSLPLHERLCWNDLIQMMAPKAVPILHVFRDSGSVGVPYERLLLVCWPLFVPVLFSCIAAWSGCYNKESGRPAFP